MIQLVDKYRRVLETAFEWSDDAVHYELTNDTILLEYNSWPWMQRFNEMDQIEYETYEMKDEVSCLE